LYESIVRKNIGWFDHKENGVTVLTTSMSADSAVINGMCTESLAPMIEGNLAMFGGIVIGMIYCWPMGLICLALSPAMAIGNMLEVEFQKAAGDTGNE
jgi:ABC-type multidrug transport system fused ATPase/permease subunit